MGCVMTAMMFGTNWTEHSAAIDVQWKQFLYRWNMPSCQLPTKQRVNHA